MTTPEESIQRELGKVRGDEPRDTPPAADVRSQDEDYRNQGSPEKSGKEEKAEKPEPTRDLLQQLVEIQKKQAESLDNMLKALNSLNKTTQTDPTQNPVPAAQSIAGQPAPEKPQGPSPQEFMRAQRDFKEATGTDLAKVANPQEALNRIIADRKQDLKNDLDQKLKVGGITDKEYDRRLNEGGRQITKRTRQDANDGLLEDEILSQQKAAVNNTLDISAGKKNLPQEQIDSIKRGLGTAPQAPSGGQDGSVVAEATKAQAQANQQVINLNQQILGSMKQSLEDWRKMMGQLEQQGNILSNLMSQQEATRNQSQRAGLGK